MYCKSTRAVAGQPSNRRMSERSNPSIVDEVSGLYAQHPDVVKALGGLALSIAIQKIARGRTG
jgi:hypothetical protein